MTEKLPISISHLITLSQIQHQQELISSNIEKLNTIPDDIEINIDLISAIQYNLRLQSAMIENVINLILAEHPPDVRQKLEKNITFLRATGILSIGEYKETQSPEEEELESNIEEEVNENSNTEEDL
jgi:hypothetical protein